MVPKHNFLDLQRKCTGEKLCGNWHVILVNFETLIFLETFSSAYSLSHVRLFATPWTAAHQASLSITNSWNLLRLVSIESVRSSNHLILCRPFLVYSIFPSIRVFSKESVLRIR